MDSSLMDEQLREIWSELEVESDESGRRRKYRRLDIENETGFRLSCYFPEKYLELLIEVDPSRKVEDYFFPNWKGMEFDLLQLDVPEKDSKHLCLRLKNREHKDVFITICSDLAEDLKKVSFDKREVALAAFLDRWTRFFERFSNEGLSPEMQRGLFGELWWLRRLLDNEINCAVALNSWKGCGREYHDFEINGQVVEVKTTMTKEPRKVQINNERQLDNKGLMSLHLLVLTLVRSDEGGESLLEIVSSIKERVLLVAGGLRRFEQCLWEAGYLDVHAHLYKTTYTIKKEELFRVSDGFPRIIDMPGGLGDIRYSLLIGAVSDYLVDTDEYLTKVKGMQ